MKRAALAAALAAALPAIAAFAAPPAAPPPPVTGGVRATPAFQYPYDTAPPSSSYWAPGRPYHYRYPVTRGGQPADYQGNRYPLGGEDISPEDISPMGGPVESSPAESSPSNQAPASTTARQAAIPQRWFW